MKTNELIGPALDWMVAKCEGKESTLSVDGDGDLFNLEAEDGEGWWWCYSTDWAQGGPIIEREGCCLYLYGDSEWVSHLCNKEYRGPTPLIAAMRCYVASKLGEEVEVPDELS